MIDKNARDRLQQTQTFRQMEQRIKNIQSTPPQVIVKESPQTKELTAKIGDLTNVLTKTQINPATPKVTTPAEGLATELRALQRVIGSGNLIDSLKDLTKNLDNFDLNTDAVNNIQVLVGDLSSKIKILSELQARIPEKIAVQLNKGELSGLPVSGKVDIGTIESLPEVTISNISEFVSAVNKIASDISALQQATVNAIQATRVTIPDKVSVKNPVEIQDWADLIDAMEELKNGFNLLLKKDFGGGTGGGPLQVEIIKDLPRLVPQPVTNINVNPLRGYVKSTAQTASTTPVKLPPTSLYNRRSVGFYNNSSSITVYMGGSDVTSVNGIPVAAGSYSPVVECGPNMLVYIVTASSTADCRVLELSSDDSGGNN